jgi:hypothetical protein
MDYRRAYISQGPKRLGPEGTWLNDDYPQREQDRTETTVRGSTASSRDLKREDTLTD